MWTISQRNTITEIAHFERMGLDGLSSNSLILTREQAVRGREGNSLLVHAHRHTLAHSLFFLFFDSFFISKFPVFSLILHSFSSWFFSCYISRVFLPLSSILLSRPYCAQLGPFPDHPLVCRLSSHHHLFILFYYSPWHSHLDMGGHSLLLTPMACTQ